MKKTTSKNIIIKLFKIHDREKILEVADGRMSRGTKTRMTANFPLGGKRQARQQENICKEEDRGMRTGKSDGCVTQGLTL